MAVHATLLSDIKISSALTTHEPQSLAILSELSKSEGICPYSKGSRAETALRKKYVDGQNERKEGNTTLNATSSCHNKYLAII